MLLNIVVTNFFKAPYRVMSCHVMIMVFPDSCLIVLGMVVAALVKVWVVPTVFVSFLHIDKDSLQKCILLVDFDEKLNSLFVLFFFSSFFIDEGSRQKFLLVIDFNEEHIGIFTF